MPGTSPRGLSLRWKLILGSVIVEVAMLTLLVLNSVRLIESSLAEQAELRLKEVSQLLNAAVGPSLAAQDYGPILDIFATTRREHGIVYLATWDNRGRLVAMEGWPVASPLPKVDDRLEGNTGQTRFDTRIPVSVGEQRYGELQFGISTRFLTEARRKLTQQSIVIAGTEVVFSLLLLALLGIWLTRHLKKLEEASLAISGGDYSRRVPVEGRDEIGRLAKAFNRMAEETSQRIAALHDSEERFRHLSELASDWYWEQDADFRFTSFAGASFREFPDLAHSLMGKRRWDSKYVQTDADAMAAHQALCERHQAFRDFEYKSVSETGVTRWISVSGEPLFDAKGQFCGYRGSGKDITERKLAEHALLESEQKFASLFQLSPLPLALTDMSSALLSDVNDAWSTLFGLSHQEAVARSLAMLHLFEYDNERAAFEGLIARYGRCELVEAHLRNHAGKSLNCELSGRMLEIGERRYFLWCVRDITEQRTVEAQIRELNTRLEMRVAERTQELQQVVDTLNRAQDELINSEKLAALGRIVAGVAHELNTPIGNSVMVATTLDEKAHEFAAQVASGNIRRTVVNDYVKGCVAGADMLVRNLRQAHNLIHSFKQVAVDRTSERRREFDLKATLEEVVATMSPQLRKSSHRLSMDVPDGIVMHSYPGPLGQIVANFVNNALLHAFDGSEGGHMRLAATLSASGDFVELRFADDGHGMDAEHRKRIFDPFFTTRLGRGGSGLGLNIVYNLVTGLLGGHIEVASTPGQGTEFVVTLPRIAPQRGEDEPV